MRPSLLAYALPLVVALPANQLGSDQCSEKTPSRTKEWKYDPPKHDGPSTGDWNTWLYNKSIHDNGGWKYDPKIDGPSPGNRKAETGPSTNDRRGGFDVRQQGIPDDRRYQTNNQNTRPAEQVPSGDNARPAEQVPSGDNARPAEQVPSGDNARPAEQVPSGDNARPAEQVPSGDNARPAEQVPSGDNTRPAEQVPSGDNTRPAEQVSSGGNTRPAEQVSSGGNTRPAEQVPSDDDGCEADDAAGGIAGKTTSAPLDGQREGAAKLQPAVPSDRQVQEINKNTTTSGEVTGDDGDSCEEESLPVQVPPQNDAPVEGLADDSCPDDKDDSTSLPSSTAKPEGQVTAPKDPQGKPQPTSQTKAESGRNAAGTVYRFPETDPSDPAEGLDFPENATYEDYKRFTLKLHNQVREVHGVNGALVWDDEMASAAESWTGTCNYAHNLPPKSGAQNMAPSMNGTDMQSMARGFYAWFYAESRLYDFSTHGMLSNASNDATEAEGGKSKVGHFEVILSKRYDRVGCAHNFCPKLGGMENMVYSICNYMPKTGKPCSTTPASSIRPLILTCSGLSDEENEKFWPSAPSRDVPQLRDALGA
ncbi:hypothetical protein DCS_05791 [Drechmeria coniospora]|uniref:SCP domain-containing protein n=1 Tax=Drechmeria coniospora TaxID=98403 RepID=A0A151GNT6_DRECN|nr:hypothetical protein DCS_05791 [Drechmeria coniospora]KYK58773.1 hypothetical protein DCS_05791 [Drechmeria coniospora]